MQGSRNSNKKAKEIQGGNHLNLHLLWQQKINHRWNMHWIKRQTLFTWYNTKSHGVTILGVAWSRTLFLWHLGSPRMSLLLPANLIWPCLFHAPSPLAAYLQAACCEKLITCWKNQLWKHDRYNSLGKQVDCYCRVQGRISVSLPTIIIIMNWKPGTLAKECTGNQK